ncbi:hypothetical protein E4631_00900 [Hymenobacter sp. UV11]|uniref:GSCFA domain-containing protein n=1 Tax=Hymenobacter sp. UV11 TaxID=1849735 RepID=UPI00105DBB4C|nr:GSCFA domain-containing protein [Hymenobacter sp. UV11]TDN37470.1 hypothetical protein A8B98_02730 [Hymenobacter sp. UV11]TFZ68657.1 hypothetical protein E4631_00900 [Hymenobacter sp. UV11]
MFRTELTIAPQERQLARTARVLTVGSCFADSIGERLRLNKVTTLVNPFGTVFQPLALAQLLRAAAGEEQDWQQHVVEARGRWQSYDFHSTIGAESPVELLQLIQETVRRVGDFVRTADTVVLTLGTAWAYRLRETGELVSNLHKLPAALFEKELLTADEIVNGLAEVHALLRRLNPEIRIVLTVSPVRHIKDTLPLNAVSKSVLRVACHYLSELLPGVSYFPAYELLTDELRDYRFYASDMLHPSEVAEDYIWDKFARIYFDADFGRFRKEWAAVRQSLGHRPLHLGAPEHRTFLDQTAERLERLGNQGVDVRQELRDVQRQLVSLPPPKVVHVPEVALDDEERIDIGNDAVAGAEKAATTQPEIANRQSERRNGRQDNRRDGRRNDRSGQDRRGSRPLPPATEPMEDGAALLLENQLVEPTLEAVTELLAVADDQALAGEEITAYPAKKKKRRSRGGAKRTARKNAARMAAEQTDGLAEEELLQELAQEAAGVSLSAEQAQEVAAGLSDDAELSPLMSDVAVTSTAPTTAALPTPPRKRGTGPTPKRSKVITKSGLVKRGERRSLYRAGASTASDSTPMAEASPAQAPIISPAIIPEILLERPVVAEAVRPTPTDTPAESAAPTKARRGRSKATTPSLATNEEGAAPTAEQSSSPIASEPAAPKKPAPRAKKATTATAAKAVKKPAVAKKAAPKKPAAKTPAPRRSRAAGSTPPAGDSPAT